MKIKKRKGRTRGKFGDALDYVKESRNYLYVISLIFLASIAIGAVFSRQFSFLDEILKELLGKIEGLGLWGIIGFIVQNNVKSAFLGLFLGVFLGVFPVINAISNGVIIGYVMKVVWVDSGMSNMWKILPHGVFELPAIIISLGLGLKLGMFLFSKRKKEEFLKRIKNSFFAFVFVVIPLLIVAAIIEGILIFIYK
jgi:stage II sporulation protein M